MQGFFHYFKTLTYDHMIYYSQSKYNYAPKDSSDIQIYT